MLPGGVAVFCLPPWPMDETNTDYRFPDEAERLAELGTQNMKELLETLERYNIDARYEKTGEMFSCAEPGLGKGNSCGVPGSKGRR